MFANLKYKFQHGKIMKVEKKDHRSGGSKF